MEGSLFAVYPLHVVEAVPAGTAFAPVPPAAGTWVYLTCPAAYEIVLETDERDDLEVFRVAGGCIVHMLYTPAVAFPCAPGLLFGVGEEAPAEGPLEAVVSAAYLAETRVAKLAEGFCESSSMVMDDYLRPDVLARLVEPPRRDRARCLGPADARRLTVLSGLDFGSCWRRAVLPASASLLLWSTAFARHLGELTGLEVLPPRAAARHVWLAEGTYTLLGSGHGDRLEAGLDLILTLQGPAGDACEHGGYTYISRESGGVLLQTLHRQNRLSLVYRSEGCARFIRYVASGQAPRSAGCSAPAPKRRQVEDTGHAGAEGDAGATTALILTYPIAEDP